MRSETLAESFELIRMVEEWFYDNPTMNQETYEGFKKEIVGED